jgi:hypothetical protein
MSETGTPTRVTPVHRDRDRKLELAAVNPEPESTVTRRRRYSRSRRARPTHAARILYRDGTMQEERSHTVGESESFDTD